MKTSRLFWGIFFLTIGLLVLAEKMGIFTAQWGFTWKFWPIVLVLWGAALLVGGKLVRLIATGVAAFVLGFVIVSLLNMSWVDDGWNHSPITETQELTEPFDTSVRHATFSLESGAGAFTVQDTTSVLVLARTESSFGAYSLQRSNDGEGAHVALELQGDHAGWPPGRLRNNVSVCLNPVPVWNVRLDVGATKLNCDLRLFKVDHLQVNAGATSMHVTLGERQNETTVDVDAGASSIVLRIPQAAGCEVHLDAPLSSKHLRGFVGEGDGRYVTENFESAVQKVRVSMDAGVSSITVERY